jgi:hypothetical protein
VSESTTAAVRALLFDGPPLQPRSADLSVLVPDLERNRVPIAVLRHARELADADTSGEVGAFLEAEAVTLQRSADAYEEVAAAWAGDGVAAVLIKSAGSFPYSASNVDALVARSEAGRAVRTLERLGYRELAAGREPFKRLFRRIHDPHLGFPIHLHTAVGWINRFLSDEEVLAGRQNGDRPYVVHPAPDNVVLITTAHWLFEDKQLTLRDLWHVYRADALGADWEASRDRARRAGWGEAFDLALAIYRRAAGVAGADALLAHMPRNGLSPTLRRVARSAWAGDRLPLRVPRTVAKTLQVGKSLRNRHVPPRERVAEAVHVATFAARAKLPTIRRGPPLTVAISGPDGAGKTTLATALRAFLCDGVGVWADYHWSRAGTSSALDLARRFATPLVAATRTGVAREETRRQFLTERPVARAAWGWLVAGDAFVRLWTRRARCRAVGGIHVFDRDAIDTEVDLASMYGLELPRWAAVLAPRPSVQILLAPRASSHGNAALYAQHEAAADVLLVAREPLSKLVALAASRVLAAYVGVTPCVS